MRRVAEVLQPGSIPLWRHPEWLDRFPWLVQGTTASAQGTDSLDFGFFGATAVGQVVGRWLKLRETTGMRTSLHSRQVHGAKVGSWDDARFDGMVLVEGYDAHVTRAAGLLLAVSVADCVPISLVGGQVRAIALVHAGWRGTAAGIVESALGVLERLGTPAEEVWLHCGPSICGRCYEVGPEVHEVVNPDRPTPPTAIPIDLVEAIATRAVQAGVPESQMTGSTYCTRCGPGAFFSHRAGSTGRQLGVLGIRP